MNDTLMKRFPLMLVVASTLLFAGVGCARPYYPPPPVAQASPLVQLAKRNGFMTGRSEGAHNAELGASFRARHTRAFHDTPGYDPQLGPFPVYRDAYRDAYLRGYQRGYNRR
jgi:hypothetical protein